MMINGDIKGYYGASAAFGELSDSGQWLLKAVEAQIVWQIVLIKQVPAPHSLPLQHCLTWGQRN